MEGSKAVRYWDKEARSIKVSRNFTFSKNEELKELQVTEIPGLEAEGEGTTIPASQTAPEATRTIQEPQVQYIPDNQLQSEEQNT